MKIRDKIREILMKLLYIHPYKVATCSSISYIKSGGRLSERILVCSKDVLLMIPIVG